MKKKQEVKDNVKTLFRSGKTWVLIAAIVCTALGIVMLINPNGFENTLCLILGIALILFGVASLVQTFREEVKSLRFGGMVPGVLFLATGLAFCIQPETMRNLIWFLVGVAILLDAVYKLEHAFTMKIAGIPFWWGCLLEAFLAMVLAVVVMILAGKLSEHMIRFSGAFLLVNGIFDGAEFVMLMKGSKVLKELAVTPAGQANSAGNLKENNVTDLVTPDDN